MASFEFFEDSDDGSISMDFCANSHELVEPVDSETDQHSTDSLDSQGDTKTNGNVTTETENTNPTFICADKIWQFPVSSEYCNSTCLLSQ